jgi:hypothetical protein
MWNGKAEKAVRASTKEYPTGVVFCLFFYGSSSALVQGEPLTAVMPNVYNLVACGGNKLNGN